MTLRNGFSSRVTANIIDEIIDNPPSSPKDALDKAKALFMRLELQRDALHEDMFEPHMMGDDWVPAMEAADWRRITDGYTAIATANPFPMQRAIEIEREILNEVSFRRGRKKEHPSFATLDDKIQKAIEGMADASVKAHSAGEKPETLQYLRLLEEERLAMRPPPPSRKGRGH